MDLKRSRLKQAEVLSTVGAGFIGAGIALLMVTPGRIASVVLMVGMLAHGWGMRYKHRIDAGPEKWETWLYVACWLALAALGAYLLYRAV